MFCRGLTEGAERQRTGARRLPADLLAVMDLQMAVEKQLEPRHMKTLLEGSPWQQTDWNSPAPNPRLSSFAVLSDSLCFSVVFAVTEPDWLNTSFSVSVQI